MKKRNKKYKPKPATLPLTIRFDEDSERTLQLLPHQELEQLREGKGEEKNWHTITCRLNIGLTLAYNIFTDCKQELDDALQCMREIYARNERIGKWILTGDELRIVGQGLFLTDEMQLKSTRRELNTAMDVVFIQAAIYK